MACCLRKSKGKSYNVQPMGRDELNISVHCGADVDNELRSAAKTRQKRGKPNSVYRRTLERSERSTEDDDEYRINAQCGGTHLVVFGNTGSGKSSLCNQLVGAVDSIVFPVARSLKAVTHRPKHHYVHDHTFTVLDTPGRDSDMDSAQSRLDLQKLIDSLQRHIITKTCKAILVFCVRCDARYARAERETYQELKKLWGNDEDFCQRLVVAFTMGDTLAADSVEKDESSHGRPSARQSIKTDFKDDNVERERIPKEHTGQEDTTAGSDAAGSLDTVRDRKGTSVTETTVQERMLEDKLKDTWPRLQKMIRGAGHRYILFNNKEGHEDGRAVRKLLDLVRKMEVRASPCFSKKEQREQDDGQDDGQVDGQEEERPRRSNLLCCCRQG